jgi:hypothetical protein
MNRPLAVVVPDADGRVGAVAVADGADGVTVMVVDGVDDCAVLDGLEPGAGLSGAAALGEEELVAGQGWPLACNT